ncbi:hypothetical protein Cs7R123_61660 [Catellatospora sp. TT07R-123]|uniref:hypothetical protein n=1 Tax=Catellatospora sp. TT07R-123 TaxID=2733863 RepID=UPI001B0D2F7A|nr:hypothetical protein [Catellatospora sp. TT07R-123]GHJ48824.1 hypothetical protein Cs7R123_61660 [Catellatospora sp. TT07R-123]
MRYPLALALATALLALAACGTSAGDPAAPASSAAAPEVPDGLVMTAQAACEEADGLYHTLGPGARAEIVKGVRAEAKGDTAAVEAALTELRPLFTSTSATFADVAGKVADPDLKAALTTLSEVAAKEATFTSFAAFESVAALAAPAESVLKGKCAEAGRPLVNLD